MNTIHTFESDIWPTYADRRYDLLAGASLLMAVVTMSIIAMTFLTMIS